MSPVKSSCGSPIIFAVDREGRIVAHAVAPTCDAARAQVTASLQGVLDAVDPVPVLRILTN